MAQGWPPDPRSATPTRWSQPAAAHLPEHLPKPLGALMLAGGSVLSGRALAPWAWWGVLGASCGWAS
jgi:hypothetical protein